MRLTLTQIAILVAYAAGMAVGQLLFKQAASVIGRDVSRLGWLAYFNAYVVAALGIYMALTFLWIWVLRQVPLSKAYPFVALSFVFTPLLAFALFDEDVSAGYLAGLLLIVVGVAVIARQ